jgi:hypothetical protein
MELRTLYATRQTEDKGIMKGLKKTVLRDESGKIVAIYPAGNKQPSKLKKTIIHNCWKYSLIWTADQL